MKRLALSALLLAGCGRYGEFRLPDPGPAAEGHYAWRAEAAVALGRGATTEWDSVDTLNPSVVEFQGRLWNFYSGFDGKAWQTGAAVSSDGATWERRGRVLSPGVRTWEGASIAANGTALVRAGEIFYWYQAGSPLRLGLARSSDGLHFRKEAQPVLETGPTGAWDERAVADPYVIEMGGRLYLYYLGQDRARRQRLGVAASDDGLRWRKLRANPVLDLGPDGAFDENGLGEPAVWASHGWYWMLYTGRDRTENRRLGMARSRDGVSWQRQDFTAVGDQPWNARVLCDPTILDRGGALRVWFGGGDVAHPAENIHGQIGRATLTWVTP